MVLGVEGELLSFWRHRAPLAVTAAVNAKTHSYSVETS